MDNKHLALVATNDKTFGRLLADMLEPAGFTVKLIKRGGSQGLSMNDYVLMVLDGDPINPIDNLQPAVVVISPTDPIAMYDGGADLVMNKPITTNVFMARIRSVLRRYGITL